MTQILQNPQKRHPPPKKAAWVIPGVSWAQLEEIDSAFDSIPGIKFFYLDEILEIVSIGKDHEYFKATIRKLLEAYMDYAEVRYYAMGGPTLSRKQGTREGARAEPDEYYNLGTQKATPDIVIEVIDTSGGVDKLEIYRRIGVKEVWFWEDGVLAIHHLGRNGYTQIKQSKLLEDLPLDAFCRYITYHDQYDAVVEFRKSLKGQRG